MLKSSRNKILPLFALSFLCINLFAQEQDLVEEMTGNNIQIRQKPNTEELLKEWFKNVPMIGDTVYALLYGPMECPRCEVTIPNFWEKLKQVDTQQKMVLITTCSDSILAKEYNRMNGYTADAYIYDTSDYYKQIFETNVGGLNGLHVLKIDRKRGNLLTGGQYTILNTKFIQQLIAYKGMLEKSNFIHDTISRYDSYTEIPKEISLLSNSKDYRLECPKRISTLFDTPRFYDNYLFFTDLVWNGTMLFQQEGNGLKFRELLQVDSLEKNRHVNVPEAVYKNFVKHKMLYYIALGTNILDDKHIGISYSIPSVVPDGEEGAYGYYNAAVMISKNIETLKPDSMITFDFDLKNETVFFNQHFYITKHLNQIIMGCDKLTWPMEFEREEYEDVPTMNPFCQEFYEQQNPYIAVFDAQNGNLIRRYGNLDTCHAISRTGYYFTRPISASYGDELLYTDGYSGKVHIIKEGKEEEQTFEAFHIDTQSFPKLDTTLFYTYDCIKPYARFFNRCITDVKFDQWYIHTITKYAQPNTNIGARYVYTVIDRKNGKITERAIPPTTGNIIGCGLRQKGKKITPFILLKGDSETIVREFFD